MHYIWFIWSLVLIAIWLVIYFLLDSRDKKREMLVVSALTAITGLAEPLFVPAYWSPPSLFNLAISTGFDIESLIFSFGTGGIAVIVYEIIFKNRHQSMSLQEQHSPRHRHHVLAIVTTPIVLFALIFFTKLNPIYSAIIALMAGGFAAWYCRPDLKKKMIVSAFLFLAIYFLYFLTLFSIAPAGYVQQIWNLKALSGILIVGIPLEELLFALSFGFIWSSIYEHLTWKKLKLIKQI